MFKKIYLLLVSSFACSYPLAAQSNDLSVLQGVSVGANLGYIMGGSKVGRTWILNGKKDKTDLNGGGIVGGAQFNYGHFLKEWYLGAEAFASYSTLKGHAGNKFAVSFPHSITLEMRESFGGALHLGRAVSNVVPYLKIGGVVSRWHAKSKVNTLSAPHAKKHKFLWGLLYGGGIDIPVSTRVAVGAEFVHTDYESLHFKHAYPSSGTIIKYDIRLKQNIFMAKIKFKI